MANTEYQNAQQAVQIAGAMDFLPGQLASTLTNIANRASTLTIAALTAKVGADKVADMRSQYAAIKAAVAPLLPAGANPIPDFPTT